MNPFTHVHSFEMPCFHMCNIVMCQKLLRSADQSRPNRRILLKGSSPCCSSYN